MISTVYKPADFPTAPIGRCTCCGTTTYDMDALNFRCDACDEGIVASVAARDWRRCPACFRTGQSVISTDTENGQTCAVCSGAGWITAAEYPLAESELWCAHRAVDNAMDAPEVEPVRYAIRSTMGSVPLLLPRLSKSGLRRLRDKISAYEAALDARKNPASKKRTGLAMAAEDDDLGVLFDAEIDAAALPPRAPSQQPRQPADDQKRASILPVHVQSYAAGKQVRGGAGFDAE